MKYSAFMLVSRKNEYFDRAVKSVMKQHPTEFRAYVDPYLINDHYVIDTLEVANATIVEQILDPKYEKIDHFINVVHNWFRAFREARYPWIRWCDDDDIWMADSQEILSYINHSDTAALHGDVLYSGHPQRVRPGQQITIPDAEQLRMFRGSGNFLLKKAFLEIYPYMNGGEMIDHGWFHHWRVGYWLLRLGWKIQYIPTIFSIQGKDPSPRIRDVSKRMDWWGFKWEIIVEEMDKIVLSD